MIKINKKKLNQHSNKLIDLFNILSITNKYNIVGSFNTEGSFFFSDIDLNESIKIKSDQDIVKIVKNLKSLFQQIEKNDNIFFTDFKIGVDDSGESLHWTFDEIKHGEKLNKSFADCLLEGTVKLDIIYRLNFSDFVEVSMLYMINPQKINLVNDLKNDIKEYLTNGRSFKALKRWFSYYSIKNNHNKLYTLLKLFNSDIGLINKVISEISIYIQLLEMYPQRVPLDEIQFAMQNIIKYYLGCIFRFKVKNTIFKKIDSICNLKSVSRVIVSLEKLNDYFKKLLEDQTKVWLKYNKKIIPS